MKEWRWSTLRNRFVGIALQQSASLGLLLAFHKWLCSQSLWRFAFSVVLILGLQTVISLRAAGSGVIRLQALRRAATSVGTSARETRLPISARADDIDQLAGAINEMIVRLEAQLRELRQFIPDVVHELGRPLTLLRAESELALCGPRTPQDYRKVLSNQLEQVDLITSILSDLSEMVDGDKGTEVRQTCSLSDLAEIAVYGAMARTEKLGLRMTGDISEGIFVDMNRSQVYRMLLNLIDNAIKYNRPSGHIHFNLCRDEVGARIVVADTGVGINTTELPLIFGRFYRSSFARSSDVPGSGLGLFFVQRTVQAHGGKIHFESRIGEGTKVTVSLPLRTPESTESASGKSRAESGDYAESRNPSWAPSRNAALSLPLGKEPAAV